MPGRTVSRLPAFGDPINPASRAAVARALGTDVVMEAAAFDSSRRTCAKIKPGLFQAFAHDVRGIPLAALGQLSATIAGAAAD